MASKMKRKDTARSHKRNRNEKRIPLGKAFVSALLTVTLATMGVTPASIAFATSDNASSRSTATSQDLANNANDASNSTDEAAASVEDNSVTNNANAADESTTESTVSDSSSNDSSSDYDTGANNSENNAQNASASGQNVSEGDSASAANASSSSSDENASTSSNNASTSSSTSSSSSAASANVESPDDAKQQTLQKTIRSASGEFYTVIVSFDKSANIPENAVLDVLEYVQVPDDPEWKDKPENKDRPFDTELIISKEDMADRTEMLTKGLDAKADDGNFVYYTKFLAIDVVADGQSIMPANNVEVTIETNGVRPADACGLEVAEYAKNDDAATYY